MKRTTIFVALIALLAVPAFAQDAPTFGVKAGLAYTTATGSDVEDAKSKMGLMGGGFAVIPMGETMGLQIEGLFVQAGAKYEESGDNSSYTVKLNYIQIPVLARFAFPGESATPYVLVGGAFGLLMSANADWEYTEDGETESGSEDIKDYIKSTDMGGIIGVGAEFGQFLAEIRYYMGLTSVDDTGENLSVKNAGFGVMFGASFGAEG